MGENCFSTAKTDNPLYDILDAQPDDEIPQLIEIQVTREAKMPVEKEAMFYNMNHKKRGKAIIFNHEYFSVNNYSPRLGTNADREKLEEMFKGFGFDVAVYNDLTYNKFFEILNEASTADHSDSDCLVIVVLSHGDEGNIYTHDTKYKLESLWHPFTSDRCPTLAGKPKLFFIQACMGDQKDEGTNLKRDEVDGVWKSKKVPKPSAYKIPTHSDFLIAYSTFPGYVSWRDKCKGSCFMQVLCSEMKEKAKHIDIETLLTFVRRRVALDFESNDKSKSQMKQMPSSISTLTRWVKFDKKVEYIAPEATFDEIGSSVRGT